EIQEILLLANREGVPVTPRVGGMTLSGLAIPCEGGIVLDLKRMDKIVELNKNSMYVVVECGVTVGQLKTYLEENCPELWFSMPHAPPSVGVIPNVLINGLGQLSLSYGANSDMINGLEVVLPTGGILRTGSCALGKSWLTKYCLPDFTGLFLGWFGATGIITKASVQLWPKPNFRDALFYKIYSIEALPEVFLKMSRSEVCEDICMFSWTGTSGRERFPLAEKPVDVPEITMDIVLNGKSLEEVKHKKGVVRSIAEKLLRKGIQIEEYLRSPQAKKEVLMVPRIFPFMDLLQGGGAEYLGCYISPSLVAAAYRRGVEIARRHGFQYLHFLRSMRTGHAICILYVFPFDKRDHDQVRKLVNVLKELSEECINLGGVLWKPSPTLQKFVLKNADSEYLKLMKKIKKLLDPQGIMAPGEWALY
ncbi:MAG: FAD-binding oxidoreductase, partial [Candidatus Freyarchaeota archaeon]|nr:FAD-binding oxidoreductase [Candidatus Jordarchaeia archaeon]